MQTREWLVAAVAALLGLLVIWAAFRDHPFAFKLWLPRLLEKRFGRPTARIMLGSLGLGLIVLGIYLARREV